MINKSEFFLALNKCIGIMKTIMITENISRYGVVNIIKNKNSFYGTKLNTYCSKAFAA